MAFFELWEKIIKQKISLRSGDWDPPHWTASIGCASGSLALAPAGGWTAGLLPVSYFGIGGRSLGWWTPVSGLKMSLWLYFVLRLLGRSANSSLLGSWLSSVWISHAFGHSSFPLCLLNVGFSLSNNTSTYVQTRASGEGGRVKEVEWVIHSVIRRYQICNWTSRLQRSIRHECHLWGVQKSSGWPHGTTDTCKTSWEVLQQRYWQHAPWSTGGKTTEPWKLRKPLQRVWQKSFRHFQAMYNAVYAPCNAQ